MKTTHQTLAIFGALYALANPLLAQTGNLHVVDGSLTVDKNAFVGASSSKGRLEITGPSGGTITNPALKVSGGGGVVFTGGDSGGDINTIAAAYIDLVWYPSKGALFGGSQMATEDNLVGENSLAFGQNTFATGANSVAFGSNNYATGENSAAIGQGCYTEGEYTIALGSSSATGQGATATGLGATASGNWSTALGGSYSSNDFAISGGISSAEGVYSVAFGNAWATQESAVALGTDAHADGISSTAIGRSVYATADYATALGYGTTSDSFGSTVVGTFNQPEGTDYTVWTDTDPIFVVGNGNGGIGGSGNTYHNAFTVYKNGKIKMDRQGDISMGEFEQ